MIHGLASKPPEADFSRLWRECLMESIKTHDPQLGEAFALQAAKVCVSAYWANAVPSHIEDDAGYVAKLADRVEEVIQQRREQKDDFHVGLGDQFGAFFKNKGLALVDMLTTGLTIKDDVTKALLEEVRLYSGDQYIADRIRKPLEEGLRRAWDAGKEVAILSHSMGTFVSYDVLWRFSHRSEAQYKDYRDKRVALYVTMGSPLGDNVIQDLLFGRRWGSGTARYYPANVLRWHNYSCLGDIVCHDSTLADDFHKNMQELNIVPAGEDVVRDYTGLYNPFKKVVSQEPKVIYKRGQPTLRKPKEGERNPHKEYGYLVQPKLAKWLAEFLR
jgi:hypothetical protein